MDQRYLETKNFRKGQSLLDSCDEDGGSARRRRRIRKKVGYKKKRAVDLQGRIKKRQLNTKLLKERSSSRTKASGFRIIDVLTGNI